jgi:hypothetical protein
MKGAGVTDLYLVNVYYSLVSVGVRLLLNQLSHVHFVPAELLIRIMPTLSDDQVYSVTGYLPEYRYHRSKNYVKRAEKERKHIL